MSDSVAQIALDAATRIMAIDPAALPGGACQHKARVQCIVIDALNQGAGCTIPDHRNAREVLPQRRTGGCIDFAYGSIKGLFTVSFSIYPAGTPWRCAEIFLSHSKADGDLERNVRDAGILASFALQHGASLDALVAGVTHDEDGAPASIVGTALSLVQAEIKRVQQDPDGAGEGAACPSSPPRGPGDGGGAAGAVVPAQVSSHEASDTARVAPVDAKPPPAPRSDRRSGPEDGSVDGGGRPASEPSESAVAGNAAGQAFSLPASDGALDQALSDRGSDPR